MRIAILATLFSAWVLLAGQSLAQQSGAPAHGHGGAVAGAMSNDPRQLVALPPPMVEHMLANMRDHLAALQEIQAALAAGQTDRAADVAESRIGMSSMERHGAHHMGPLMPPAMQDAGTGMHRAASRLAVAAKDTGVTGDLKPALAALAAVTAQCVGCHAGFRVR